MKLLFWKCIGTIVAVQLASTSDEGITGNETLKKDFLSTEETLTELSTESDNYSTTEDNLNNTELELNVTLETENEDFSTMATDDNLTTVNVSDIKDGNQFTVFMIQKQCTSNKSGEEFDMFSDLKFLVEEVDDCLYFAFIKVRANSPSEIKDAMLKFEEKKFHVIKVKQKVGNQDKTHLILKEHLDCKECLVKGRDIKNVTNRNIMYDINSASFYLVMTGGALALSVVIINIYFCYFRRKQGRSEIPRFKSKPEKFNIGPIPRPTILNGDNLLQNPYISGMSSLGSSEQQSCRDPRNENCKAESRRWMAKKPDITIGQQNPFTRNSNFGVW